MLRKSYSVFKKKQMGKLTILSIWRNSSVVISPGHFLRLLHMSRGLVWVVRDNPHGAQKWRRLCTTRKLSHATNGENPKMCQFWALHACHTHLPKAMRGICRLSGISRPRGPVTNVWPQAANFTQPHTFAVVVI